MRKTDETPAAHPAHPAHPLTARPVPKDEDAPTLAAETDEAKEARKARRAEHTRRGEIEEQAEALIARLRVPKEDGGGRSFAEILTIGRDLDMDEEEVMTALDVLEGQGFVERSIAHNQLAFHPRSVLATQRIVVPDAILNPAPAVPRVKE